MAAHPDPARTEAFIAHLLERYHEVHRAELPGLVRQAQALQAHGLDPALAAALQGLAQALEQHMFKEEMRMFPMMEQGGNTLLHHLVADMEAEHRQHDALLDRLRTQLAAAQVGSQPGARVALQQWQRGVAKLLADLAEHVRLEEKLLFPRFVPAPRPARPTAGPGQAR